MFQFLKSKMSAGKSPYIDIRLKVIATSAINIGKVAERILGYRMKANLQTNKITLAHREIG